MNITEKIFVYISMYLVKRNMKTFSGCIRYDIFRKHMYVCTLCILVCFMERGNFSYKNYINCRLYIRKGFYCMVQTWLEIIHYLQAQGGTVPTTAFLCHPVFYVKFNFCAVLLPKCCHANQSCVTNRFSPWQL